MKLGKCNIRVEAPRKSRPANRRRVRGAVEIRRGNSRSQEWSRLAVAIRTFYDPEYAKRCGK